MVRDRRVRPRPLSVHAPLVRHLWSVSSLGYTLGAVAAIPFERGQDPNLAVSQADKRDLGVERQVAALTALKDGWLDGGGAAFDPQALTRLSTFISCVLEEAPGMPHPRLYPLPEGSILAEWSFPNTEVSVEFDLNDGGMLLVGTHIKSQACEEERSNWERTEAVAFVIRFVTKMAS